MLTADDHPPEVSAAQREAHLLDLAGRFSFRGRIDRQASTGPIFVSADGSTVTDLSGKRYLDFNSGQMCAALGHNHPRVVAAIREVCATMLHAHSSYYNVWEIELAARLAEIMPEPLHKSLFGESGADANELAMVVARMFTGGQDVYSPHVSFHGLSMATRSVTFGGWRRGHGELPSGGRALLAPYCYRCPLDKTYPSCELACLSASFELVDAQATDQPAAVITEPLFSAGGVIEPPPGWLGRLKELCKERGMLLIVDEEQTGLGKLGTMFGFDTEGIVPDIVTLAKHFGGGVGISSLSTSPTIEEKVVAAGLTVTHSHSNDPLLCAAGTASLDVVEADDVPGRARRIGARILDHLRVLAERFDLIGDVRGRGLLTGIELVRDRETREPATHEGTAVSRACFEQGLIFSTRRDGSVLRFVPPSTTTDGQVDQAMETLGHALEDVSRQRAGSGHGGWGR